MKDGEFEPGDIVRGTPFGDFEIMGEIGRGGMGRVLQIERLDETARYALKTLHRHYRGIPEIDERFAREALLLRDLGRHPGIIKIHSFFRHEGIPCLVMDLLSGRPLSSIKKRLSVAQVCQVAVDVLGALNHIYREKGVVHRDIKAENLMLNVVSSDLTQLVLIDFGVFKQIVAETVTDSAFSGTKRYAAPEQFTHGRVDHYTDLFAVGVLLFELLTGVHPFAGRIGQVHLGAKPTPLKSIAPEVPDSISEPIMAALETDPQLRPKSARDFARPFRRLKAELEAVGRAASASATEDQYSPLVRPAVVAGPTGTLRMSIPEAGVPLPEGWDDKTSPDAALAPPREMASASLDAVASTASHGPSARRSRVAVYAAAAAAVLAVAGGTVAALRAQRGSASGIEHPVTAASPGTAAPPTGTPPAAPLPSPLSAATAVASPSAPTTEASPPAASGESRLVVSPRVAPSEAARVKKATAPALRPAPVVRASASADPLLGLLEDLDKPSPSRKGPTKGPPADVTRRRPGDDLVNDAVPPTVRPSFDLDK